MSGSDAGSLAQDGGEWKLGNRGSTGLPLATALVVAISALVAQTPSLGAEAWLRWFGPDQNGSAADSGVFGKTIGLKKAWSVPLGPAYSGIVVSGGRVVTMFSNGEKDWMAALDAETGREIWRYDIGAAYKGRQSAEDGPRSTPVIDDGVVYGLGPRGKLFALDLGDGSRIWATDLRSRFGSTPPAHGFTTSPLVEGNVLVVLAGGSRKRSIAGIDKRTGKTLWTQLSYKVEYQSPVLMTLAGRRQIVIADRNIVAGLVPETGEVLWTQDIRGLGTGHGPQASYLGGNRFLIKFYETIAVFELQKTGDGYALRKIYRAQEFKKSYLAPIQHDGYLYGFNSSFLTCANAETGEEVWKSREPEGQAMIVVDGHLVILARDGFVVVAQATPEGYREKARVQVLERDSMTWPSFAGGKVYVRSMEQIGAASIGGSE